MKFFIIILMMLFILGCGGGTITPTILPPTSTPTITPITPTPIKETTYYVSPKGDDANPGSLDQPWQTIQKAVNTIVTGDTVIVREGEYFTINGGWNFRNSGTQTNPITLRNYPGEQVVIKINQASDNYPPFRCWSASTDPIDWQTTKADFIHVIGTDVNPRVLSNGIVSQKGIVIQGVEGEQVYSFTVTGCDYWEVAGIDFIETAAGIRTWKRNYQTMDDNSADYWHVHDNRVYNYYRESGMQFNGNFNIIENNEIYKVSNRLDTPYGCQMLNLLGNNNIIRGNILSRMGSTADCLGILFEWDLSDANIVEQNKITDVPVGIAIQGGDNNLIQNNYIIASPNPKGAGVEIASYDNETSWPCNDYAGSGSSSEALLPPNDPSHPDYPYYFNPRNCHSMSNQVISNTILGFKDPWSMYPVLENSNIFRDNITSQP
jgi:parallel beta-helix repeat protein